MKDNVDLTSNRDFRIKAVDSQNDNVSLGFMTNMERIKSNFYRNRFGVPQDDYYIGKDTGGIMQGNATERMSKKFAKEFCLGNYCDCCGEEIKPYVNDCLCPRCSQNMVSPIENLFSASNL